MSVLVKDFPYYLKGTQVINKEINLLTFLSEEEKILSLNESTFEKYTNIDDELTMLIQEQKSDTAIQIIKSNLKTLKKNNPWTWININLRLINITLTNKPIFNIILFSIIGMIVALVYVLFDNTIKTYKRAFDKE